MNFITDRIVWPYPSEPDSLYRWRAFILSSILLSALILGSFALVFATVLIVKESAWGLAIVDFLALILCLVFIFIPRVRFEVRAFITLLMFYVIGIAVVLSVGPLSGGPAWLFAFAVLAGVLIGSRAAFAAILMNAVFMIFIGMMISSGQYGDDFPFFSSRPAMITAGVNFIILNAITAISVSALLKGVFGIYKKKEELADHLEKERQDLISTQRSLKQEIRDRKSTEKALNQSENYLRTLVHSIPDLIWLKDQDGIYLSCNSKFERLYGAREEEIIGKTDYDFVDRELADFFREHDRIAMAKGGPSINEEEVSYADDGHVELLETIKTPMYDADGKLIGVLGIARDISERKQAEKEKIKAQKVAAEHKELALVGKIAGKMAHDFNNILGAIMGNTELSILNCKDQMVKKKLDLILDQTLRGRNLTRNLVAFAKSQEPKQEFFKLNDTIELVLNLMVKDLENVKITRAVDPDIPELLADPGMIEHALVNLIQNSIHATSKTQNPEITVRTYHQGQRIWLEIEDNGCGIPNEHIENIYTPSFTLKGSNDVNGSYQSGIKGTGYGMSNVKKYINQHKGTIKVDSETGIGTKFAISLPVIKRTLTQDEKIEIEKEIIHTGKKILLVEDEIAISEVQSCLLSSEPLNHKVDTAHNGQMATDLFLKNQYNIVSLDYVLPGDMNGMDVYHFIRQRDPVIPILFISGNIEFLESIEELRKKDQHVDHLSKPCQNKDYISSMNRLLD